MILNLIINLFAVIGFLFTLFMLTMLLFFLMDSVDERRLN